MAESKFEFIRTLQEGNVFYVEKCLDADQNLLFAKLNQEGDLCIHHAAKSGNLILITALLKRSDLLVNKTNQFNETALHYAAREGHLQIVQLLLSNRVNFKKTCINPGNTNHGKTAMEYAEASQKFDCVKEIQQLWIYIAAKNGNTKGFNDTLIELAVHSRVYYGDEGFTPFHIACMCGQLEIVKLLAHKEPKVLEIKSFKGFSPLMLAAYHGHEPLVKFLLEMKVNFDTSILVLAKFKDALALARDNEHFACVEILEEAYYQQHVIDQKFISFEKIIEKGLFKLAELHVNWDLELKINLFPVLHVVAAHGYLKIAQLMLQKNPEWLNVRDMYNRTALFDAIQAEQIPMAEFLINQNIELNLNPEALTKYDLLTFCGGSDRILNLLILRFTKENPELNILDYIYSGSQALDLMMLQPSLIKTIKEDDRFKTMIEQSSSISPNQIKFYRPRQQNRKSGYGIIDIEQHTSLEFQPKKSLGEGHRRTTRLFKSPDGQKVAIKSLIENVEETRMQSIQNSWRREMKHNKQASPDNSTFALFFINQGGKGNGRFIEPYYKGVFPKKFISKLRCEYEIANVILEIVKALQEFHAKGLIHGDFYNNNILIKDKPIQVKFFDLELTRSTEDPEAPKLRGMTKWYAPELCWPINREVVKPDFSQDVYSFGFLLETILSEHPSYAKLLNKFPCIEIFIQQARNFAPAKRPGLDLFHQELEESLSTRSLSLG